MRRNLRNTLIVFGCFAIMLQLRASGLSAQYDLGSNDMVTGAGVSTAKVKKRGNTVYIGAPGPLGQYDTEYILTNDINADGTAFRITGSNITLNLNGYKVVYLNKNGTTQTNGVLLDWNVNNVSIMNGKIVQGEGRCLNEFNTGTEAHDFGNACNPIYARPTSNLEIAGLEIVYKARDTGGIFLNDGGNAYIYNNTLHDLGDQITNRHQGVDAIKAVNFRNVVAHHNLIKRARQVGIRTAAGSEVYNNEIHIDSNATNSSGINVAGGSVHHNKVYGVGIHPIGIWPGSDIKVYSNYVDIESTRSGVEYESPGAACVRMTWYNDNVEVMYNTFVLHESGNFKGRALWLGLLDPKQKAEFHNNVIIANNRDGKAKAAAIAVDCNNESPNLVFRNNKVISNWGNVVLSDEYGWANGYARFIDNTFVRQDNHPNYLTVRSQYSSFPSTAVFINNRFEGGASLRSMDLEFFGSGKKEIAVAWYLDIAVRDRQDNPADGARVLITDNAGQVVFDGVTDGQGKARAEVFEYLLTNSPGGGNIQNNYMPRNRNRHLAAMTVGAGGGYQLQNGEKIVVKTPHTITVSRGGQSVTRSLRIQKNRTVRIVL